MGYGFILDALEVGLTAFNKKRGLAFKKEDCSFEDPVDLLTIWGGVTHPTKKNTAVKCKHLPTKTEFTLYYDRYSITGYISTFPLTMLRIFLLEDADGDLRNIARSIQRFQGIPLEPRDLVSATFDPVAKPSATTQYTVTIAPTSYNYRPGEKLTVAIAGKYYRVGGKICLLQDSALKPDIWYEDRVNQGGSFPTSIALSQMATYQHDYTSARTYLRRLNGYPTYITGIRMNATVSTGTWYERLCKALTAVDGLPWSSGGTTAAAWNLNYAWVVYNGPVRGAKGLNSQQYRVPAQYQAILDSANPAFDNVVLLYTELTSNLNRSCVLLHYNNG